MTIGLRQALLASAAAGAMVLVGGASRTAEAANECGSAPNTTTSVVNCTPANTGGGGVSGGIEYVPGTGGLNNVKDFTLNIGDGTILGAVTSTSNPILNVGQSAGTIATIIPATAFPTGGVASSGTMNITQYSTLSGSSIGGIVWVTGSNAGSPYNATITNDGTVLANGAGSTFSLGNGLIAVSGNGNATITNNNIVNAANTGVLVTVGSSTGTAKATNEGTITAVNGDGMATGFAFSVTLPIVGTISANIPTAGKSDLTNNDAINAGRNGMNAFSTGDASVTMGKDSVINAGTVTNGAGAYSLSLGGNAIIKADAASQTTSTGPGVVAGSLTGTATVDAGVINSGSGAVSVAGFTFPTLPNIPILGSISLSGGAMALAAGNATANAHGNITTTGTFGVLAFSATGDATATTDAGITVDPPIGVTGFALGAGTATATNNATVVTTQVGLLGVNVGNGEVLIQNSQTGVVDATASGAGVLAIKVGAGSSAPFNPGAGDYSVKVTNDNTDGGAGGRIDAPTSVGVGVLVVPTGQGPQSNVLVSNTNNAYMAGAGSGSLVPDLLGAIVAVGADGNVDIINDHNSTMTNTVGSGGFGQVVLAGGNIHSVNDHRSDLTGTLDLVSLGGNVTFDNDRRSDWTSSGLNVFGATGTVTINNQRGADINMLAIGGVTANLMVGGGDVTINNNRGATFNMIDILGAGINVMASLGGNVRINNEQGAEFNMLGIAGVGVNIMVADDDVIIDNNRGADFTMAGLIGATANVMVATHGSAIIYNNRGADFTLAGINGNFMFGAKEARIDNDSNASFTLAGLNGNFMSSLGNTTINNSNGASFNLLGINQVGFLAGGASTFNNSSVVNVSTLLGIAGFADFTGLDNFNNENGLLNMRNGFSDFALVPDDPVYGNGVGDVTRMDGNFNGGANSSFGIDAFLSGPGPASSSDQLWVGGDVTQTTALLVNDLNPGVGAYNPTGIRFAHVEGDAPEGSFFLPGGPIDKGFFSYDIVRIETNSSDWLLASAPNDRADELPALITGAQTLWYESSGVWLDRTADLRRQIGVCSPADEAKMSANVGNGTQVTAAADVAPECYYQRYGLWFRGFGGQYDRNEGVDYDQDIWGAEGGFDVVLGDDPSESAFIVGILGGYIGSKQDFNETSDEAKYEGGSVGAYATWLSGGWFADLLVKANFLNVDYDTSFNGDDSDTSTDATSWGARLDTGYRFNVDEGFFIEPQATLGYVNTDLDDFDMLGTDVDPDTGESLRGRLGVRIGGSWDSGNMIFEPFLTGSVWHEFEGDNEVELTSGASTTVSDQLKDTWGEVGGGLNVFNNGSNVSFFAKVDAQVGGDIDSWSGKLGGRIGW